MCRRETGGTGILGVRGEEYVLTELNQLLETDVLWNRVVLEDLDGLSDASGMPCADGYDELSYLPVVLVVLNVRGFKLFHENVSKN